MCQPLGQGTRYSTIAKPPFSFWISIARKVAFFALLFPQLGINAVPPEIRQLAQDRPVLMFDGPQPAMLPILLGRPLAHSSALTAAHLAPPTSIASISLALSRMAPELPTPAGMFAYSASASGSCTARMSARARPVCRQRTPHETSKPTPPADTTPPPVALDSTPPALTNQTSATFGTGAKGAAAPGGLSVGGGPKFVNQPLKNSDLLDALVALAGHAEFGFDVNAWRAWFAAQKRREAADVRRDK